MGSIMGSQKIMGSDYGSNISVICDTGWIATWQVFLRIAENVEANSSNLQETKKKKRRGQPLVHYRHVKSTWWGGTKALCFFFLFSNPWIIQTTWLVTMIGRNDVIDWDVTLSIKRAFAKGVSASSCYTSMLVISRTSTGYYSFTTDNGADARNESIMNWFTVRLRVSRGILRTVDVH
jgi:hypothetical protein